MMNPLQLPIRRSSQSCECGLVQHAPHPEYTELHHVVPQAWQLTKPPGTTVEVRGVRLSLIDPRTKPLGPTCHRNVHVWIVRLMRELEKQGQSVDLRRVDAAVRPSRSTPAYRYFVIASLGLWRARDADIDLWRMTQLKLYGEA